MATNDARGTKRTCQNGECGARFYDLKRDPIICPICASTYVIASLGPGAVVEEPVLKKKVLPAAAPGTGEPVEDADTEDAEALAEIETDDEEPIAAEDDATFLEEEEDGGDVTGIIGGPVGGDEET